MAVDIDEAIRDCDFDINAVSEDPLASLFAQMRDWIRNMFTNATAIFGPDVEANANQRTVRDWVAPSFVALGMIEGTGLGQSTPFSASQVVDAVFRTLNAVKFAEINGRITTVQRDAVVTLYTATWE
jgi:hypothetical protein